MTLADLERARAHLLQQKTQSIDLICTAPPFDLAGNDTNDRTQLRKHIAWFMPFANEFARVLKPHGSLILAVHKTWLAGLPVRSLLPYELLLHLCKSKEEGGGGFVLAQELFWYETKLLTTPMEWTDPDSPRLTDPIVPIWWLSTTSHPKADNRRVLKPYSQAQRNLMRKGDRPQRRPSEHRLSGKFGKDNGGAIPANMLIPPLEIIGAPKVLPQESDERGETYEIALQLLEFVIALCTEEGDSVFDPFTSSDLKKRLTEVMGRRWIVPTGYAGPSML